MKSSLNLLPSPDDNKLYFRIILNYLRNRTISVDGMSSDQISQLKHEVAQEFTLKINA